MSEIDLAADLACRRVYDPVEPEHFDTVLVVNEDTVGVKRFPDAVWIVPAGTENLSGWINDCDILTTDITDIGTVHAGFYQNVPSFVRRIEPMLKPGDKIKIAAHSRGCPIGALIGAALKMRGYDIVQMYLFESPDFCFKQGVDWFAANIPNVITTRCVAKWLRWFGDPVPFVPEPNPWQDWQRVGKRTLIFGNPRGWKKFFMAEYHMGEVVIAAVAALAAT